jgi:hypothetical protein
LFDTQRKVHLYVELKKKIIYMLVVPFLVMSLLFKNVLFSFFNNQYKFCFSGTWSIVIVVEEEVHGVNSSNMIIHTCKVIINQI